MIAQAARGAGRGAGTRRDPRESREPPGRPEADRQRPRRPPTHTLRVKCTRYRPDGRDESGPLRRCAYLGDYLGDYLGTGPTAETSRDHFGAAYTAVYIRRSWSVLYKGLTPFAHAERRMSASMK